MIFLYASQNESMSMAMEGSRLCSANRGQFVEVIRHSVADTTQPNAKLFSSSS